MFSSDVKIKSQTCVKLISTCNWGVGVFLFQDKFTDDPTLGFVDAGIVFVIHSPKKVPQFDGIGLLSPVGMHARVTIRQVKVNTGKTYSLRELSGVVNVYMHK